MIKKKYPFNITFKNIKYVIDNDIFNILLIKILLKNMLTNLKVK